MPSESTARTSAAASAALHSRGPLKSHFAGCSTRRARGSSPLHGASRAVLERCSRARPGRRRNPAPPRCYARRGMYRRIDPQEIVKTLERLAQRVEERFPGSSLRRVVAELLIVAQEATQRAQRNRRPILALRGLVLLLLGAIGVSLIELPRWLRLGEVGSVTELVQVLEPSISIAFFLSAFAVYLLSIE